MVRERYLDVNEVAAIAIREMLEAEETAEYVAVETHDQRFRSYVEGMGKEAEATMLEALDQEHARGGEARARRGEAVRWNLRQRLE
jgi:hypothetical protein